MIDKINFLVRIFEYLVTLAIITWLLFIAIGSLIRKQTIKTTDECAATQTNIANGIKLKRLANLSEFLALIEG